jgi:D-glycero-D-manno-heptose 1,7-bisphosphate phosphatase
LINKKVVFLDRDGVINKDTSYVSRIEDFEFIDGVFKACLHFKKLGFEIIIVTNQSGIGRAYFTQDDFNKLNEYMKKEFLKKGIEILDVFFCPHKPEDKCNCRKPKVGMIEQALNLYSIDLKKSWMIGDKSSDIQLAINSNIKNSILINSSYIDKKEINLSNFVVNSLDEIINIIKE